MKDRDLLRETYVKAANDFASMVENEEKQLLILSFLRLISFIASVSFFLFGVFADKTYPFFLFTGFLFSFLLLLKLYTSHTQKKEYLSRRAAVNRNEAVAASGDFSVFGSGDKYQSADHDFSNDIDIFGTSSLFQYLNRTITGHGSDILAGWLSDPYLLSPQLTERQEVIRELASKSEWRHHFMASGTANSFDKHDIENLSDWLTHDAVFESSLIKKTGLYLLPSITITVLVLVVSGIIGYTAFTLMFLLNLGVVSAGMKRVNRIHNTLSGRYRDINSSGRLLEVFEKEHFNSAVLVNIQNNLTGSGSSASAAVKKLGKLTRQFDSRLNLFAALILNGLFLWDYHSVLRLEKWKAKYRTQFPVWLDMLGSVDAFISLANYCCNNPACIFPLLSSNGDIISARDLGHPLIDEDRRICNSFSSVSAGMLCIITGANMAGKSTFLRTVAVNSILAMAGAPVCAKEMSFIPVRLFTSMRTTDSLPGNESYFYAELKRLKVLKSRVGNGEPLFFILDEILKGTNSADKSLGSRLFLRRMVELKGSGMIATHDTSVCEMEKEFPDEVVNMCFEIEIEGEFIRFDYKLHDGITRKMNAALLMKQMGIIN